MTPTNQFVTNVQAVVAYHPFHITLVDVSILCQIDKKFKSFDIFTYLLILFSSYPKIHSLLLPEIDDFLLIFHCSWYNIIFFCNHLLLDVKITFVDFFIHIYHLCCVFHECSIKMFFQLFKNLDRSFNWGVGQDWR